MKEFIENLTELLGNPKTTDETKELVRDLLRKQLLLENDLTDLINKALKK